jgi:hypothetical protein
LSPILSNVVKLQNIKDNENLFGRFRTVLF